MQVRLLGPVEVDAGDDGHPAALGGPRQRALLADLALHAGRTVLTSQLVDDLWGENPPPSARHTIETYVSRLRRVLAPDGGKQLLLTRGQGYRLDVASEQVDALLFTDLVGQAQAVAEVDGVQAAALLTRAGGLWRGSALADVRSAGFAAAAAARYDNDRLDAQEALVDVTLRLGRHREVVSALEQAVAVHPYRERPYGQLMLALYRCGRQADALAVFQSARGRFADELGIEPGADLRELERKILQQAPELSPYPRQTSNSMYIPPGHTAPPTRQTARAGLPSPRGRGLTGRRLRTRWVASAAAMVMLAVLLGASWAVFGPGSVAAASVGVSELDGGQHHIARSVELPGPPGGVAVGGGSMWVTSSEAHALYRVDPRSGVRQTITVGAGAGAVAVSGSDVWVANSLDGTLSRVSMVTDQVVQTVPAGPRPTGVAVGDGLVWVADQASSSVMAIDANTGAARFSLPLRSAPYAVTYGAGSTWLTNPLDNSVTRIGPAGGPGVEISVGGGPTAVTFGSGSVWVANGEDSTVSRIDPSTDSVAATLPVGDGPDALAVAGTSVWVANRLSATLSRISASRNTVASPVVLPAGPVGLVSLDGRIWAATQPQVGEHSGGSIRVVSSQTLGSIDPAVGYPNVPFQLEEGTYDTLVTTERVSGSAGAQLVPDLALTMPSVTAGGTVYSFVLRPGLRYSDGTPVRPEDFRYAIERAVLLDQTTEPFLSGIDGVTRCRAGVRCDLTAGIEVSDSADTVTFHLVAPDPEFLQKLAFPFTAPAPATVPLHDVGNRPVPSTGPYEITSYLPGKQVVFVRNPHFSEWSAAAEPAGSPDRIVWTFGEPVAVEIADIAGGRADWTIDDLTGHSGLATRYPGQVHANPGPNIEFAAFNTTVPPFNDARVRRAFSLAADRNVLVASLGGPGVATPTCQFIPPGMTGYRRYCPYTVDPGPGGAWVGPDLPAARKLVAASGTVGMKVTVWSTSVDLLVGRFMVTVLDQLGYRASMVLPSADVLAANVNDSRRGAQATDGSWTSDYPSPSDTFDEFFRCTDFRLADPADTRNGSFFCDHGADSLISTADQQDIASPAQAATTWAAVDRRLTDDAPWVPLANTSWVDFLSTRVTNYQYNSAFGLLLDQLAVTRRG